MLDSSDLIKSFRIKDPSGIDLENICSFLGLKINYINLSSCDASLLIAGAIKQITVNSQHPRERQRFSIAHELGHYCLDHNKNGSFRCEPNSILWDKHNPENAANSFASQLLMPYEFFRPRLKDEDIQYSLIKKLANLFQTSLTATAFRIVETSDLPIIITFYNKNTKRFSFVKGPSFPEELRLVSHLPSNTFTDQVLHLGESGTEETNAFHWFTNVSKDPRYFVIETSFSNPIHVTSVLWWKDEKALVDAVEDIHQSRYGYMN